MADEQWKIFLDIPDDLDETWSHVALFGGMANLAQDDYSLACHFKQAGDLLIQCGLTEAEAYEVVYPAMFTYRHAIELYLKAILNPEKRNHNLKYLVNQLEHVLWQHHATEMPEWFQSFLNEFIDHDPRSTTFRYPGQTALMEEHIINLPRLKRQMAHVAQAFHRIYMAEKQYGASP